MKKLALALILAVGLFPASAAAQAVTGTIFGTVTDATGAAVPGVTVTLTHTGTGLVRAVVADSGGRVHGAVAADRRLHRGRGARRVQDRLGAGRAARRRSARAHQPAARGRRDGRDGYRRRHLAARADVVVRAGHDGHQRADRSAAAQRPQLREPHPHGARRAARHPGRRTSTARAAWPGAPRHRSRPTASAPATTTSCSTASTTTRRGCRPSSSSPASTRSTSSSCRPRPTRRSSAARSAAS